MLVGMRPSIFTPVFLLLLSDQVYEDIQLIPVAGQLQNATVDPDDGAENSTLNVPQPLYRHLKADKDACAEGTVFCAGVYETVPNIPVRLQDFLSPPMLLMLLPYAGCYRNSSVAAPANRCKCSAHASNFTAETSLVYTVSAELEELQGQLWNGSMRTCRGLDADALRPRHATLRVYERYTRSSAATTNVIYSQLITIVCLYVSISLRSLAL
ncbi:unnamed protein product, partial [Mesorhabditis spiculigera]